MSILLVLVEHEDDSSHGVVAYKLRVRLRDGQLIDLREALHAARLVRRLPLESALLASRGRGLLLLVAHVKRTASIVDLDYVQLAEGLLPLILRGLIGLACVAFRLDQ